MLTKIHLINFKCFQDQEITLRPLTLLTGLNGAGKSTILQSLLLLRQSFLQGTIYDQGLSLNGDLIYLGTGQDLLNENSENENIGINLQLNNEEEISWIFGYDKSSDLLPIISTNYSKQIISIFSDKFHYLSAERIGPRPYFNRSNYKVKQQNNLGINGEYTTHFLSVYQNDFLKNKLLKHPNGVSENLKAQVDAWLSEITPGTKVVIGDHTDMDIISLRYKFTSDRDISNTFRATNVGFGLTYTLPVLVSLLAAKPGTTLLIENPEAHLHPKGQSIIGKLMALAAMGGVQILVETHSDHVLNGIRLVIHGGQVNPEQVSINYFTRREIQGKMIHYIENLKIDKNGRIDSWPEGFFDEWDKSLDQLLDITE
ncbi:AAA family ATPase [Cohnella laeviribosi]|uniref:AAA family ATPase n=1 Tax=Cohnella laeviribosi TaxID=380174 RepID=UPI003D24819E